MQFLTTTLGYAIGKGILLKTVDQGENWSTIAIENSTYLNGLSCLTENIFFISRSNGLVMKTTDGGITFTEKSITINQNVADIQFLNEQIGYSLVGLPDDLMSDKMIYKTINGGISFSNIGFSNLYEATIFAVNENTVWNVSASPALCFCTYFLYF